MREIKFRAWDKENKRYFPCLMIDFALNRFLVAISEASEKPLKSYYRPLDALTIEQFTGLRDKNGREIYEGDICRYPTCSGRDSISNVIWDKFAFYCGDYPISEYLEIIGNIHENPELLS